MNLLQSATRNCAAAVLLGSLIAAAPGGEHARASSLPLGGLWSSARVFGPRIAGGIVTLERRSPGWAAAIGGFTAVAPDRMPATFRFGSLGELRVRRSGRTVLGQWIQPADAAGAPAYATPVHLVAANERTWRGRIAPLVDATHMFLLVRQAPDGTVKAFIRNPEANAGAFIGLRTIVTDGDSVAFVRPGRKTIGGWFDPNRGTLTIDLPGYPGSFVFRRAGPGQATGFVAREGPAPSADSVPADLGDGWRTGSLREAGLDPIAIATLVNAIARTPVRDLHAPYLQSLAIARHGKLVLDEYFFGFDAGRPHDVRSAGKSITTLMLGRAIQDGAPIAPRSPIAALLPRYLPFAHDDERKKRMTIADLMDMSPGYACDDNDDASPGNEDTMQSQTGQPDWYKYTLDLPTAHDPGTAAIYCSAGINLLGAIVSNATHRDLVDEFYDRFAGPMQFRIYAMWLTPPPLDVAYMGGGDYFLPRDFLKFGQLFLDRGRWNGTPIVDPRWLAEISTKHSHIQGEIGDYGYGWHLYAFHVAGRTVRAIGAGGNGGQLLFVFPSLDMTVMITAGNYGQYGVWKSFIEHLVPERILPAAL